MPLLSLSGLAKSWGCCAVAWEAKMMCAMHATGPGKSLGDSGMCAAITALVSVPCACLTCQVGDLRLLAQ
jgi:hypothetical protein